MSHDPGSKTPKWEFLAECFITNPNTEQERAILANDKETLKGRPYFIIETDEGGFSEAKRYKVTIEEVVE